ncbi:transcriptional regulator with XRE-family HTH domain [Actinoalloteichus hoggarensis]|uniref:helix-turn-helix transcriptional regulator n=1 Tax=Actinoalloteichus hoggarensis TaxID=1470176 RepID=UPI000B8B7432|nr:helix-turn-helix transcriptional regulator [Actinoalloteichus hoggarensis]MBB5923485.1 transcriptional regulator with XRE-family HTH domain [Actinoalloteichus hoggarensis]
MSRDELADFLRRRREALRPEQALADRPRNPRFRRTPGLRREEVAALAGMSTSYYERLEQARAPHPSPQVLASLGTALRLTESEREHLARLAGQTRPGPPRDHTAVPADVHRLLHQLGRVPAYLVDEQEDVVAWNDLAAALIVDFEQLPTDERNTVRVAVRLGGTLCSSPPGTEGEFARQSAADLRRASARHPGHPVLARLIGEFSGHSEDFAVAWRGHEVRSRPTVRKHLDHPTIGKIELDRRMLSVPDTALRLVLYTADPGSPSAAALERLDRVF